MNLAQILQTLPICIDGRMQIDTGTGVSTYSRSLRTALKRAGTGPLVLDAQGAPRLLPPWIAAVRPGRQDIWPAQSDGGEPRLHGIDIFRRAHVHFGYRQQLYRLRCAALPFGIMHWTYPLPIRVTGWINIYTVHDMIPSERPDLTPIDPRRHLAVLRAIAAEADRLVTVSEAAQQSIVAGLGCDAGLVVNCGQAADVPTSNSKGAATLPAGLLPDNYLLIVGTVEPRKNIAAILAAYRASDLSIPLVIAGPDGWQASSITQAINTTPSVIRLPYLARAALLDLIAAARALLFVSQAEGFGLPLIEAMALGTPVLTSDRGALAEIAGGAALLVDPTDSSALREAIIRIVGDEALRRQLRSLGQARSAEFSSAGFADRLRAVYLDALRARQAPLPAGAISSADRS